MNAPPSSKHLWPCQPRLHLELQGHATIVAQSLVVGGRRVPAGLLGGVVVVEALTRLLIGLQAWGDNSRSAKGLAGEWLTVVCKQIQLEVGGKRQAKGPLGPRAPRRYQPRYRPQSCSSIVSRMRIPVPPLLLNLVQYSRVKYGGPNRSAPSPRAWSGPSPSPRRGRSPRSNQSLPTNSINPFDESVNCS